MSSSAKNTPISIRILDKDYTIACPADERDALIKASIYLSDKMKEIKAGGKLISGDRVAVMAALNITHELLQLRETGNDQPNSVTVNNKLLQLQDKITQALNETQQLDF